MSSKQIYLKMIQQGIGIFLAVVVFIPLAIIVDKFFQKSPEQIAKKKCIGLVQLAKTFHMEKVSVQVDGKTYQCDMNLKYE